MKNILIICLFSLASCTCCKSSNTQAFGKFNFDYQITNQSKTNLIQVFSDEENTFLHFKSINKDLMPRVFSSDGKAQQLKPYRQNYYYINGLYYALNVQVGSKFSTVTKNEEK